MDVRAPLPSGRGIGLGCRSPHVAVLRSRECSSLTAGIKSLVVQMLGPDTHTGAACAFDLDLAVLSPHDRCTQNI